VSLFLLPSHISSKWPCSSGSALPSRWCVVAHTIRPSSPPLRHA
jgi:hypothetical protein